MVAFLTGRLAFPPHSEATKDGLIAIGGDLTTDRLLLAYKNGIFPWPMHPQIITWFSPDPRAIIALDGLRISRSLRKKLRQGQFEVRVDHDFETVIRLCSQPTEQRPSTWITEEIRSAYVALHRAGRAHSVETYSEGTLVGGLYGVTIGGLFAGESMFSRESDASKVALVALVNRMKEHGLTLLDVQVPNPHLLSMGAHEISRREYLVRLSAALKLDVEF